MTEQSATKRFPEGGSDQQNHGAQGRYIGTLCCRPGVVGRRIRGRVVGKDLNGWKTHRRYAVERRHQVRLDRGRGLGSPNDRALYRLDRGTVVRMWSGGWHVFAAGMRMCAAVIVVMAVVIMRRPDDMGVQRIFLMSMDEHGTADAGVEDQGGETGQEQQREEPLPLALRESEAGRP
jgi:hypothetical protein